MNANKNTIEIDANDPRIGFLAQSDCCRHILERHPDHDVLFRKPVSSHPRDNYLDVYLAVNTSSTHLKFFIRWRNLEAGGGSSNYVDVWAGEDAIERFLETVKLFDANQAVVTPPVWKGKQPVLKLGSVRPLVVAIPAGSASQLKTQVVRPDPLVAPFAKGQAVGSLKLLQGEKALFEVPLQVLEPVEQAGVLGRAWDAVRLWIK
jgi:hypothetical protein